ncbi:unnamed protein product (macronuclear) [Paramecium tetraurelia]|uniref:Uncharacterized protein n=1 Tax=Paramecium tetraurelia TaxID=5888 RepID=A0CBM4_PARTE|nr:uncharacterized protein GSPATT00036974001 [Paramecium tetraurelia]CAK68191.1 unnamed protein product [Paramecium tetraurelia]|eukprot:XP_001435588.1 hypothetical protein (macronuclear) [Paramecium tetraurelia strain d4-2]
MNFEKQESFIQFERFQSSLSENSYNRSSFKQKDFESRNSSIIFDVPEQLQRILSMINKENVEEMENNIIKLQQISENVKQFKSQLIESIDKYIGNIDQYIDYIQIQMGIIHQKIQEIPLDNQIEFCLKYQEIEIYLPNYAEIKEILLKNLVILNSSNKVNNLEQYINQFGIEKYKLSQEILQNLTQENQDKLNNVQCEIHQSQIKMVHLSEVSLVPRRLACLTCVEEYPCQYMRIETFQDEWQIQQQRKLFLIRKGKYKYLMKHVSRKIKILISFSLRSMLQLNNIEINQITIPKVSQNNQEKIWSQIKKERLNEIVEAFSRSNHMNEFENKNKQIFALWQYKSKVEVMIFSLETRLFYWKIKFLKQNFPKQSSFKYQSLKDCSVKQKEFCYAIAISLDLSIMAASCKQQIRIFEIRDEIVIEVQMLNEHQKDVLCLAFMKPSDSFISGSEDKTIILWKRNQTFQWLCQQKLKQHLDSVYCLILSSNDDLIISGSKDKTIRIWERCSQNKIAQILQGKKQWLCKQTISSHTDSVFSLAINETSNQLISCGKDNKIIVFQVEEKGWIQKQVISVQSFGLGISFINNDTFCIQPQYSKKIEIYELKNSNYIKTKEIQVKIGSCSNNLFPQQMIKSKQILINKNGSCVNFISFSSNLEKVQEYSIEFSTNMIYGVSSNNGEYLFTWDFESKLIQVWKYKEE